MATLRQVADALASTIHDVTGLRAEPFVGEQVNPPALFLQLDRLTEEALGYGSFDAPFLVVVVTPGTSERAGQGSLLDYANPTGDLSVWQAIGNNQDLGLGDGTRARVSEYRTEGDVDIGGYRYYGGVFVVQVTLTGVAS